MAHIQRLIALLIFVFSLSALASVPQIPGGVRYTTKNLVNVGVPLMVSSVYPAGSSDSVRAAACNAMGSFKFTDSSGETGTIAFGSGGCNAVHVGVLVQENVSASCPANSVLNSSGTCDCSSGYVESGGACKVKQDKCKEAAESGWGPGYPVNLSYPGASTASLGNVVGTNVSTCFGGCTISGDVNACWGSSSGGSAGCQISSPIYTGASCTDPPETQCPAGSSPSQYAAGVCIPDKNPCPSGYSPSKYAAGVCIPDENPCPSGQAPSKYAQGVCLPKDDPNAVGNGETADKNNCPAGYVPSRYVKGVCIPADTTVTTGGVTTCLNGVCTTTKPDGTSDSKDKDTFCTENPRSPLCKEGQFSGSCEGGFSCDGDAIQCAIAQEQHQRNCKLYSEDSDPNSLTNKALNGADDDSADALKGRASQVDVGSFDQSGLGWSRACPADPEYEVSGRSFTIPFSKVCGLLEVLSLGALGITLLGCLLWVIGKKE